jgi:hypothetical protein
MNVTMAADSVEDKLADVGETLSSAARIIVRDGK